MPYLKLDRKRIYYASSRNKEKGLIPLLLIHGAGGSHRHWLFQIEGVDYPIIAVDLPGHGRSEGQALNSIEAYADLMLNFIHEISPKGIYVGGHSMGGAITLKLALKAPELIKAMVLIGTGGRLRVKQKILNTFAAGNNLPELIEWAYGPEANQDLTTAAHQEWINGSSKVFYNDFSACNEFDVTNYLEQLKMIPTTVICGTSDLMTPPKYSEFLKERLKAELNLINNAGHMSMLENPNQVNTILEQFLRKLG